MKQLPFFSKEGAIVLAFVMQMVFGAEAATVSNLVLQGNIECIYLPSGSFQMGCPAKLPRPLVVQTFARPEHMVHVSAFYIGKYPITVEQFIPFVNATGLTGVHAIEEILLESLTVARGGQFVPKQGMERRPVIGITHAGAMAYCNWLTKTSGSNCRLPTEAEWEYTARGRDGRLWPWGNVHKKAAVWFASVGQHPELATPDGIHDLDGPVFQWCLDAFDTQYYSKAPQNDPVNEIGNGRFVYRGGPMGRYGWFEALIFPPTWKRFGGRTVDPHGPQIGFRIAVSPSGNTGYER